MATISLRSLEIAKTLSGNSPWTMDFQEAASQTYLKGAILTFDANGRLAEAGANPTRMVGVAAEPAHNYSATGTANTAKVWVASDDTIFVGNLSGSSVSALTDVGGRYGVAKSTFWHVDKTVAIANARVIVIDLDSRDLIGDTNARVHFMILSNFNVLRGTS